MRHSIYLTIILSLLLFISACKDEKSNKTQNISTNSEQKGGPLTAEEVAHYKSTGKSIAQSTFEAMSGNLKDALTKGGVKQAAEYCNIVAMPLTDSLSRKHQASIKRTSLKLRNPENKASEEETKLLNRYQASIDTHLEINPVVIPSGMDSVQFYAPIYTKKLCLTCHGTQGESLSKENEAIITALYPQDRATGYKEGDLRGIWSIRMQRD